MKSNVKANVKSKMESKVESLVNSKESESEIEFGIDLKFSGGTMSQTANWIARPPRVRHTSASNRRASATRPPRSDCVLSS